MAANECFPVPPRRLPEYKAEFSFIKGEDFISSKPYFYGGDLPPDKEYLRSNITYKRVSDIDVVNIGDCRDDFHLEYHGLQFVKPPANLIALPQSDEEMMKYLSHLADWICTLLCADKTIIYDYAFRKSLIKPDEAEVAGHGSLHEATIQPATVPHIDHTKENGLRRAMRHLNAAEREKYLGGDYRIRILNIWRPITRTVQNWPLAFCDPTTVSPGDLVRVDRIRPTYAGEINYLQYSPKHRWYFLKNQTSNDIAIFNGYDSCQEDTKIAFGIPHASFQVDHKESGSESVRRESLEIRAIVISTKGSDTVSLKAQGFKDL